MFFILFVSFLFCKIGEQDSGREEMMGKEVRGECGTKKCIHMYVNIKIILLKMKKKDYEVIKSRLCQQNYSLAPCH
jgi:hypothetical protein